jgi:hypothetical protein
MNATTPVAAQPAAQTAPIVHTLSFTKEKDTKNTVRFSEDVVPGQPPIIGTLYLQKWAVGSVSKVNVTVTLG